MIYRAHVQNAQIEETVASQIVARLVKQSSVISQLGDGTDTTVIQRGQDSKLSSESVEDPLPRAHTHTEARRMRSEYRSGSRRTKPKKVSTDTLFSIVIFDEFLRELASLSHEHSCLNPALYHSTVS